MSSVQVISSLLTPSTKTVLCRNVSVSLKNNNSSEPNVNQTGVVEVHQLSRENPVYTIQGAHLFSGSSVASSIMKYEDWLTIAKQSYNGSNAPRLLVKYGFVNDESVLSSYAGSTTGIPFAFDTGNLVIVRC
jgi:hypothetical protein